MSYQIKDLGEARFILGMCIDRDPQSKDITISQKAYSYRMLEQFNLKDCSPVSTLLPARLTLSIDDCPITPEKIEEMKRKPYHEALGSLMWLQVATRPDLSYTVNLLSHFVHNPGQAHWNALKHALVYVKGTMYYGITYHANGILEPVGYVGSDFAGCKNSRQSTKENVFIVARGPISWESKHQETVALSTVEAEYMAFSCVMTQAI